MTSDSIAEYSFLRMSSMMFNIFSTSGVDRYFTRIVAQVRGVYRLVHVPVFYLLFFP
jgi:hypothetical protein